MLRSNFVVRPIQDDFGRKKKKDKEAKPDSGPPVNESRIEVRMSGLTHLSLSFIVTLASYLLARTSRPGYLHVHVYTMYIEEMMIQLLIIKICKVEHRMYMHGSTRNFVGYIPIKMQN